MNSFPGKIHRFGSTIVRSPILLVLFALSIRFLYLYLANSLPTFHSPGMDAEEYRSWAESIMNGTGLSAPYLRGPLYPNVIAWLAYLFGGDTFWPVRILQILVSSLSVYILYSLGRKWFSETAGWIAGFTWACYGLSIYFDAEGLIVSLYTNVFIVVLWILDLYRNSSPAWKRLCLAAITGLLIGACTLLRANALLWWPVLLVTLLFSDRSSSSYKRPVTIYGTLLAFVIMILLSLPTLLHNQSTGGRMAFSLQGGINLYIGSQPESMGAFSVDPDYGSTWTFEQVRTRAEHELGHPLSMGEVDRYYQSQALQTWLDDPEKSLMLLVKKAYLLLHVHEIGNNRVLPPFLSSVHPVFAFLVLIGFPIVALFGFYALFSIWKSYPQARPAIVFMIVHMIGLLPFFISARYRFPIVPVLILCAAGSIPLWQKHISQLKQKKISAIIPFIDFVVFAVVITLPNPLPRYDTQQADWLYHQGNALLRTHSYEEAIPVFYQVLEEETRYRNAHLNIGACFLALNSLDSANVHFLKEYVLYPSNSKAANNLGVIHQQSGEFDEAMQWYRRALYYDSSLEDSKTNLAYLLNEKAIEEAQVGNIGTAKHLLEEAIGIKRDSPSYRLNYALIVASEGNTMQARQLLQELILDFPEFLPAQEMYNQLR